MTLFPRSRGGNIFVRRHQRRLLLRVKQRILHTEERWCPNAIFISFGLTPDIKIGQEETFGAVLIGVLEFLGMC